MSSHSKTFISTPHAQWTLLTTTAYGQQRRFIFSLGRIGQQTNEPGPLDRTLSHALTFRTVAATLAGIDLASVGQQLLQGLDVFVINILGRGAAKPTLGLIASATKTGFPTRGFFIYYTCHIVTYPFLDPPLHAANGPDTVAI
jgi:hypothetical protein